MAIKPVEPSLNNLILERWRWIFDPVDLDHVLQIDKDLARKVMAQRLETQAEINRQIADASDKVAKLMR